MSEQVPDLAQVILRARLVGFKGVHRNALAVVAFVPVDGHGTEWERLWRTMESAEFHSKFDGEDEFLVGVVDLFTASQAARCVDKLIVRGRAGEA